MSVRAGIRRNCCAAALSASGVVTKNADIVAVLTGNVLKDPDYIYRYHTGDLKTPSGIGIESTFGNKPQLVPNNADAIVRLLAAL